MIDLDEDNEVGESANNAPPQAVTDPDFYSRFGTDEESLLAKFARWRRKLDGHYSEWLSEAKECFDLVAGRQWTDNEISEMEEKLRIPTTFNRIQPTIDAVAGAEIQGRQQIQYFPREVGDSAVSEILTQGAEYEMGECDGNEEDSDAFRDCLICGVGVTETRPDTVNGEVSIICDRIDPLEILFDPGNRKACFADARFLKREKHMDEEEFEELWPGFSPTGDENDGKRVTVVDPRVRYTHGELGDNDKGDVVVCEWQWYENETTHLAAIEGKIVTLTTDEHAEALEANPNLDAVKQSRRVYYRAFTNGPQIMEVEEIYVGDFTYKAITGKRDRNKGTFYGLVRPMKDPQKFANKFFSQILHIINSNAKGGVMVEEGAVEDIRNFEASYAQADAITWVNDGALQGTNPRIIQKQAPAYPQGSDRMMQTSVDAIRDVTGVSQEMLGLADRDQPGVLEQQRKQQTYGILAAFFDARRRYMKLKGRLLLKLIQKYLPADKLVRIVGEDGSPQYVPLALEKDTMEYDIVVDEAPASPNQKVQTFQMLTQLMPLFSNADLPASFWAEMAKYSPLPAGLSAKLAKIITDQEKQQEAAEQAQAPMKQAAEQLQMQGAQADVADKAAGAQLKQAQAAEHAGAAQTDPVETDSAARLNAARVAEIENRIVNDLSNRTKTQEEYS